MKSRVKRLIGLLIEKANKNVIIEYRFIVK